MLSLMNEPLFDRYVYTVYPCRSGITHHPLSKFGAQREALNCPSGGLNASTSMLGLSRRSLFASCYIFRYDGLNGSFFFIKVQAITKKRQQVRILIIYYCPPTASSKGTTKLKNFITEGGQEKVESLECSNCSKECLTLG